VSGQADIHKQLEVTLGVMLASILFLYAGIFLARGPIPESQADRSVPRRPITLDQPLPQAEAIETADEFAPIRRIPRPAEPADEPPVPRLEPAPVKPLKPLIHIAPVPVPRFHLRPPKLR
jgi:hypothetical protein